MLSLFLVSSPQTLIPSPSASMRVLPYPPTHSHLTALAFPYTGASSLHRTKGPLLPLMSIKAILCYVCGWSHRSLHMYSLFGGLVPGS